MKKRNSILFRVLAMLAGLLPLVLLEMGLRVFNVGAPGRASDPLSGFNRNVPLFERHGSVYRTASIRQPFFCAQEFTVEKPTNGFRIFCFGGSTVYGHPYQNNTAFPKWLEMELAAGDPARNYQAINCGGVSYASYRLAPIVREVLDYQPDLVIVATGENEFLEDRTYHSLKSRSALRAELEDAAHSLRIVSLGRKWVHPGGGRPSAQSGPSQQQLSQEVQPKLDEQSGYASYHRDDAWHDQVLAQFEDSIRAMIKDCRKAGVPLLLLKLGSNLRDCPPFKSEHRPELLPAEESEWQTAFDSAAATEGLADKTESPVQLEHALRLYHKAQALDWEHALLAYRIARVCDRLGRKGEALEYFLRARDQDVCPLRMPSRHEAALTRIAAQMSTPLVDVAGLLASKCPDGIPGNDWYLDHVHPNIRGHQLIAQAIAVKIRENGLAPGGAWPEEQRRAAYQRQIGQLGEIYFADGRRRVAWLDNWARRQRLFDETLPKDAAGFMRLGFKRLELGENDDAWDAFHEALNRDQTLAPLLKDHAGELLAEGRSLVASNLLENLNSHSLIPGQDSHRASDGRP